MDPAQIDRTEKLEKVLGKLEAFLNSRGIFRRHYAKNDYDGQILALCEVVEEIMGVEIEEYPG